MADVRLLDFTVKTTPVPADIVYLGNSASAFDEVRSTIAQIIAAYPALSSIAGLTTASNKMIYATSANVYATTDLTAFARTLLDDADAAAARTTLGVAAGGSDTQVQFNDGGAFGGDSGLTFNKTTNILTAGGFAGPLTGDVTGNVSGSSGSCTGNAATATTAGTCTGNAATVTTNANLTGVVTSTGNATLFATMSANYVLLGNGTATPQQVAPGTSGSMLISNSTTWLGSTSLWPNTVGTAGKMVRSDGTTNGYSTSTFADTYAVSTLLYASGTNAVTGLATANSAALVTNGSGVPAWQALSAGQILIGTTSGAPSAAAINSGTNILVSNGSGTITVNCTNAASTTYVVETTTSRTMTAFQSVIANNAGLVTLTIPATTAVGDIFEVVGLGAGLWKVQANTGQVINVGSSPTSSAGSITATNRYDSLKIVCVVANTTFVVTPNVGNWTIA